MKEGVFWDLNRGQPEETRRTLLLPISTFGPLTKQSLEDPWRTQLLPHYERVQEDSL